MRKGPYYTAHFNEGPEGSPAGRPTQPRTDFLSALGRSVRARRLASGYTLAELAARAGVSARFLVQLEAGQGNISVSRLQDVAEAMHSSAATLLSSSNFQHPRAVVEEGKRSAIALVGLRGAGKTAVGQEMARRLGMPFYELDAIIADDAGMSLSTIFDVHGEAYFRKIERFAVNTLLPLHESARNVVVATSGSIVTDAETWTMLRERATTIWLKARPRDHWARVVAQGDGRPMAGHPSAMEELRALFAARKRLYQMADHVVDTSRLSLEQAVERALSCVKGA